MSYDYWLGLVTLPGLALAAWGLFWAWIFTVVWLDTYLGISFEGKLTRRVDKISDYTLRRDIWWERSFGPIFVGGWYREPPTYPADEPTHRLFNRWIGIGLPNGPCVIGYRKHDLGMTAMRSAR